jgi:hypothetical protein
MRMPFVDDKFGTNSPDRRLPNRLRRCPKWMIFLSAFIAFCVGSTRVHADTLYSQPTNYFGGFYSQDDTTTGGLGNFATVYDDFTLSSTATIGSVSWVGNIDNSVSPTAFTIDIFANSTSSCPGGEPSCPNTGSMLYSTTISGNAGQTFLKNDFFGDPAYSYSDPIDFTATAGTEYWISIVAAVPLSAGDWSWESGTGGDGYSYQNFFGATTAIQVDEAFDLNTPSSAVPEPASAALLGVGLAMLALASRRFKRRIV